MEQRIFSLSIKEQLKMDVQNSCKVNREHARIFSGVLCDSTKQSGLITSWNLPDIFNNFKPFLPKALPYVILLIAMLFFIYAIIGMQVSFGDGQKWRHTTELPVSWCQSLNIKLYKLLIKWPYLCL